MKRLQLLVAIVYVEDHFNFFKIKYVQYQNATSSHSLAFTITVRYQAHRARRDYSQLGYRTHIHWSSSVERALETQKFLVGLGLVAVFLVLKIRLLCNSEDSVSKLREQSTLQLQWFGEEISEHFIGKAITNFQFLVLHPIVNEEVSGVDMTSSRLQVWYMIHYSDTKRSASSGCNCSLHGLAPWRNGWPTCWRAYCRSHLRVWLQLGFLCWAFVWLTL